MSSSDLVRGSIVQHTPYSLERATPCTATGPTFSSASQRHAPHRRHQWIDLSRRSTSRRHAIHREKTLKHYAREWKFNLIERTNPHWLDLYPTLPGVAPVPRLDARGTLDPRTKSEDDS